MRRTLLTNWRWPQFFGLLIFIATIPGGCSDSIQGGGSDVSVGVDASPTPDATSGSCSASQCSIGGKCYDNGTPNPDNACEACIVIVQTTSWTPNDSGTCDDGNACTNDDRCVAGSCGGTSKDCDDDNPCTDDTCDAQTGVCANANNTDPCDDADPCTEGSQCKDGDCIAGTQPADCEDGNPCTADSCDPTTGCTHTPSQEGASCDDEDTCTENEACKDGECVGEKVMDCDDGNECTVDICSEDGGCSHASIAAQCVDENPCTEDLCDPAKGCVYPFKQADCDDGNICTEKDQCVEGACLGSSVELDDGNPCTTDACTPESGITHSVNTDPCDDGDACTLGDACKTGVCESGATYLECDDDNVCTDDWCDAVEGCINQPNNIVCDDDSECTTDDLCKSGACVGVEIDCDDGKPCTVDTCKDASGCKHVFELTQTCRPNFNITYPSRGQTVKGSTNDMTVTIKGSVKSDAGPITALEVNGILVNPDANGSFSHKMNVQVGGNVIVLKATDSMGTVRERVQSFLWSSTYKKPTNKTTKSGIVTDGLGLWLGKEAIDDGSRNYNKPKNLATLAEMVVASFDVYDSIPSPAAENWAYALYVTSLNHDPPKISLDPQAGYLRLNGTINNVVAGYKVDTLFDVTGTVTISKIALQADVEFSIQSHQLVAEVKNVAVTINGNDIDIEGDGISGSIASFVAGFFKDTLADTLETEFEAALKSEVEPVLEDSLSTLTLDQQFALPALALDGSTIPVSLVSDFNAVKVTTKGLELVMRAGGYATSQTDYDGLAYLGAPSRVNCGSGTQSLSIPSTYELEASVADDTVNSLLFAAWRGGLLEFKVPDSMLGEVDVSDFGITDLELSVSGMVAPTMSDCNDEGAARIFLGDVQIDASLKLLSVPMDMKVWASLAVDVDIHMKSACNNDGGKGCPENAACEEIVCDLDDYCCKNAWDDLCAACAKTGVGYQYLDCSSAIAPCQSGIGLEIGSISQVDTELYVANDELIATEPVINDLIKNQMLPNLTSQLAGSIFTIPLPEIEIGGVAPGIPEGTVLGFNPIVDKRIGGNTVIQGQVK